LHVTDVSRSWISASLIALISGLLLWLIVTHSLVAYLQATEPETALTIDPESPAARLTLTNEALVTALEQKDAKPQKADAGAESEGERGLLSGALSQGLDAQGDPSYVFAALP
jgi:hypothetical protein